MTHVLRTRQAVILIGLGMVLPVSSGCVRTDDGTLLMSERPMYVSSAMDPVHYSSQSRERREREWVATTFPPPPASAETDEQPQQPRYVRTPARRSVGPMRVQVAPPFQPSRQADAGLTCKDETGQSGRVRVNCN